MIFRVDQGRLDQYTTLEKDYLSMLRVQKVKVNIVQDTM
jgi:hypothetical protein